MTNPPGDTLAVLDEAAQAGLLHFEETVAQLRKAGCRVSGVVIFK